jgi:hypothetical protein
MLKKVNSSQTLPAPLNSRFGSIWLREHSFTVEDWEAGNIPIKEITQDWGVCTETVFKTMMDPEYNTISCAESFKILKTRCGAYDLAVKMTVEALIEDYSSLYSKAPHPYFFLESAINNLKSRIDNVDPETKIRAAAGVREPTGIDQEVYKWIMDFANQDEPMLIQLWADCENLKPNTVYSTTVEMAVIKILNDWLEGVKLPENSHENKSDLFETSETEPSGAGRPPEYPKIKSFCLEYYEDHKHELQDCSSKSEAARRVIEAAKQEFPNQEKYPSIKTVREDWLGLTGKSPHKNENQG